MTHLPSSSSQPPVSSGADPDLLRQVMRHWTTGVSVVTSLADGVRHGMTVNSFTSISLNPPVVHVSLANLTRTHTLVQRSGIFAITILAEDQQEVADSFAGRLPDDSDRFQGLPTFTLASGAPLIEGGLAFLDCRVRSQLEVGTTTVFFGDVVAGRETPRYEPLVYFNRLYRGLQK